MGMNMAEMYRVNAGNLPRIFLRAEDLWASGSIAPPLRFKRGDRSRPGLIMGIALASFGSTQLKIEPPGKRKAQMRKCPCQTGLWAFFSLIFTGEGPVHYGKYHSWAGGGSGFYKKVGWANH